MDKFNFEDVVKKIGEINKMIYGVNPFRTQDKKDFDRYQDSEDLKEYSEKP